ncbi:hypothetical protein ACIP5T_03135 [Microbacterium sp. NPDC088619]|uniref:hypothetical protein n=1 Tax=Microbacterium sp. NPDC088619 TaxID=3364196 RepID=UPI003809ADFE
MEASDTLGVVAAWIEAHCVIPDGDDVGRPFELGAEQFAFVVNHYKIRDDVDSRRLVKPVDAFTFRRSQLVRAQKWGKSPLIGAFVCAEGVGPVVFTERAQGGEVYDCRDFGCGCGWEYEYDEREPMGRPWSTPLIQITATSEDQTDNTYDALRPMIDKGPLTELIPKTGEEFIRLPGGGRIDVVTSKANSRLGQRITFAAQDETGLWVASNGGHKLARTQRRGLAGMGGRSIETTNSWDPAQDSVAQQTYESQAADINKDFQQPPANLSFRNKAERRKIFAFNYRAAPWVSVDAIEAEAAELLEKDPADAERFFGNRIVAGSGAWMDAKKWALKHEPRIVAPGTAIVLGFDGSDVNDWTGIRAETLDGYQFTPSYHGGRLTIWDPAQHDGRVPRGEVMAAFEELFDTFDVARAYFDPPYWQSEISELEGRYQGRVFRWETYRPKQMHAALERFKTDVVSPDAGFSHDGNPTVATHIRNAVEVARNPYPSYLIFKASETQKIDLAMSSVLAHEAASDARASGYEQVESKVVVFR